MTGSVGLTAIEVAGVEAGTADNTLEQVKGVAIKVAEEKKVQRKDKVVDRPVGIGGAMNPNLGKPGGGRKLEVPVNSEGAAVEGPIVTAGNVLLDAFTDGK